MTVCNMSIEGGARAGLVAPDETTFAYLEGRDHAPTGADVGRGARVLAHAGHRRGRRLRQGGRARRGRASPRTSPGAPTRPRWSPIDGLGARPRRHAPTPASARRRRGRWPTWASQAGTPMREISVDTVFLGSCTNSRIEDLRAAAAVLEGRTVRPGLRALAVPGSHRVKAQAEAEGLDKVFVAAGFEWREPGCSMCLAMNPDKLGRRRALRLDLEPQLRGPPGPRRPHPPRLARRGRRHRGRRARSPRPDGPRRLMEPVIVVTGRAVPLDRSDVDTDQIIPSDWLKRVERTGFGAGLFAEWRDDRDFVLNDPEFVGRDHPGRRAQLRHRLVARARRVGADGLRVPGRRVLALRRHLPQQLHEAGPAAGAGHRGARPGAARRGDRRPVARDHDRRGPGHDRGAGGRAGRAPSRSTSSPASGCSTGGTTSASRCATPTTSTPTSAGDPPSCPRPLSDDRP